MGTHEAKPNEKQKREKERQNLEKQDTISSRLFGWSLFAVLILFSVLIFADVEDGSPTAIVLCVLIMIAMVICGIGLFYGSSAKREIQELNKKEREDSTKIIAAKKNSADIVYDNCCKEINRPRNTCESDNNNLWINTSSLFIMEAKAQFISRCTLSEKQKTFNSSDIKLKVVPVSKIQYFTKEGDIQYTSNVSGGGGGGSSIKGAVVGAALAGDAGAIIGSRKKIAEIKTTTVKHDERKTVIRYYENDVIKSITFSGFAVYEYLLSQIPEKDLLTIQLNQKQQTQTSEQNVKERLKQLKELFDEGLLSPEEYNEKRKDILNNM